MLDLGRLRGAYEKVRDELLAERTPDGHWVGALSSSALSTATAVSALAVVRSQESGARSQELGELVRRGVEWLVRQQNADGGFGDTDLSHSNIATTMLVVAALHLAGVADQYAELIQRANAYIDSKGRLNGLRERYGIDKTFVVPIMTNLALAGIVEWREVDPLPFELACVPQSWFRFVGMPVVSYAIPALVAIGQARFFHAPPRNPLTRLVRWLSISRSRAVLRRMQPDSGGYLEATPLTSFVVMSLASKPRPVAAVYSHREEDDDKSKQKVQTATNGRGYEDDIIREGVKFLVNSVRPDGSWPIDTNLATWNTTLAINALAGAGEDVATLLGPKCLDWLLSCQHLKRHPFTGADPGGFGWSDLSGAVPDADDTPGALLALRALSSEETLRETAVRSLRWLLRLQNRDGGWPTFCRGWGRLPFDRSGTDLTAHALRARHVWREMFGRDDVKYRLQPGAESRMIFPWERGFRGDGNGLKFLKRTQHPDGSWSPLWFGNQDHPHEENPVYGTAKVLMAYRDLGLMDSPEAQRGVAWLVANQIEDGGWGSGVWRKFQISDFKFQIEKEGSAQAPVPNLKSESCNLKSSIEETAVAVEILLAAVLSSPQPPSPSPTAQAVLRGLAWLIERVENNQHRQPAPIGFYFAKLWYYERLYPLTFTVAALGRASRQFAHLAPTDIPEQTASSEAP
jgi:squalene-hopene/tetraprenyl-beta-curcumene cyclase